LVNIVAGKKIAEELLQNRVSPEIIAEETFKILEPARAVKIRQELSSIRAILGAPGASQRAAIIVAEELNRICP